MGSTYVVQVAVVLPLSKTGPNYWQTTRLFASREEAESHVKGLRHPKHYRIVERRDDGVHVEGQPVHTDSIGKVERS